MKAATILPEDARRELIAAARVESKAPPAESFARRCALDETIKKIKRRYPQFFNTEKETPT